MTDNVVANVNFNPDRRQEYNFPCGARIIIEVAEDDLLTIGKTIYLCEALKYEILRLAEEN